MSKPTEKAPEWEAGLIASCRKEILAAALKLNFGEDIAEDIQAVHIIVSPRKTKSLMGYYEYISGDGLGRIWVYSHLNPTPEVFRDTLLHEFAHALVHWFRPEEAEGHGKLWKYIMKTLGLPTNATYHDGDKNGIEKV